MATQNLIRYEDLQPGDHIQITQRIKVGLKIWFTKTSGKVLRRERRRNGLNVERANDDFVFQDIILLQRDGAVPEETTIAMDEFTQIERAGL